MRDVTAEERRMAGLSRLNSLARQLLDEKPLDALLTPIVDTAKEITGAEFSAVLVLRPGSQREVAHFAYNAPRELFPERLPRAVGLLAEPIRTRAVVRTPDIRGHPQAVGIPVEHPPIAALLAVPILLGDRVLGEVVVANSPRNPAFDETDEALMDELAAHAAHAVTLARIHRAHEDDEETRRGLVEIALHDIRTPLTVARGFLTTIRSYGNELSDEDRDTSFDSIEQALDRIQSLVEGPLLGNPDSTGGPTRAVEVVDVNVLMDELVAHLSEYRPEVSLEVNFEPGGPESFVGDRVVARELLDNLVTNAIKHSTAGDVVSITVRPEGESVRFDVTDRGPGIPPSEQDRVFDKGYRTHGSVAAGIPGTGQGLSIVRRLAELQGGTVGLSSRTGQGSTFWATLPLEPSARRRRRPEGPAAFLW